MFSGCSESDGLRKLVVQSGTVTIRSILGRSLDLVLSGGKLILSGEVIAVFGGMITRGGSRGFWGSFRGSDNCRACRTLSAWVCGPFAMANSFAALRRRAWAAGRLRDILEVVVKEFREPPLHRLLKGLDDLAVTVDDAIRVFVERDSLAFLNGSGDLELHLFLFVGVVIGNVGLALVLALSLVT